MAYFIEIHCRLAIRLCVGYHANGREKYRTLNIWNVRRDATAEEIAMFVRALEPLLDGRVVRVLLIRKDRVVMGEARGRTPSARYAAGTPLKTRGARLGDSDRIRVSKGSLVLRELAAAGRLRECYPNPALFPTSRRTHPAPRTARAVRLRAPPIAPVPVPAPISGFL